MVGSGSNTNGISFHSMFLNVVKNLKDYNKIENTVKLLLKCLYDLPTCYLMIFSMTRHDNEHFKNQRKFPGG